jgi:aspartate/methionine/tyrosine aminotransferase
MDFDAFAYMEWAKRRSPSPIDLAQSGVPGLSLADLPVDLAGCEINGEHPYGYPPLLEAIAARAGVSPDNVIPAHGASEAIFLACAALLDRGDIAVVERPGYEQLVNCARMAGAEVRRWERRFERGYGFDRNAFEAAVPDGARLVLMTNLHNPSGVLLERDEVRDLAEIAGRKGARVFIDEIYLDAAGPGKRRTAFGAADNIVVASSLTKVYGLSGLRCGWILAPDRLVLRFRRLMDHLSVVHAFIAEQIAARLFPHLDALRERRRSLQEGNLRTLAAFIAAEPRLDWVPPAGGIVGFPCVDAPGGGDALAVRLAEHYGTAVVPGGFFGAPEHFRLGFGLAPDALDRGLAAIRAALHE